MVFTGTVAAVGHVNGYGDGIGGPCFGFIQREVGVVEATIAPRSSLIGRTLGDITFRERYGLQVLAIWREDKPIRTGLAQVRIKFGDALLLQLVQGEDGVLAVGPIVVDTGLGSGDLPLTPSQAEGPYYPVVSPSDFDNDLLRLP